MWGPAHSRFEYPERSFPARSGSTPLMKTRGEGTRKSTHSGSETERKVVKMEALVAPGFGLPWRITQVSRVFLDPQEPLASSSLGRSLVGSIFIFRISSAIFFRARLEGASG